MVIDEEGIDRCMIIVKGQETGSNSSCLKYKASCHIFQVPPLDHCLAHSTIIATVQRTLTRATASFQQKWIPAAKILIRRRPPRTQSFSVRYPTLTGMAAAQPQMKATRCSLDFANQQIKSRSCQASDATC